MKFNITLKRKGFYIKVVFFPIKRKLVLRVEIYINFIKNAMCISITSLKFEIFIFSKHKNSSNSSTSLCNCTDFKIGN